MNTGQLILTMGGMFLLALLVLRVNNNFLRTSDIMYSTKYGVLAISLATSIIEEASGKKFDANTDTTSIDDVADLTAPTGLGPKYGEIYPFFNDFDDFNRFTKTDSTLPSAKFDIKCRVVYVEPSGNKIIEVNKRTWFKKLDVFVTSKSMKSGSVQDTVKLSTVFSYWFAR